MTRSFLDVTDFEADEITLVLDTSDGRRQGRIHIARRKIAPMLGVEGHVEARAYALWKLAKDRVRNDALEQQPVVVYLSEDLATARVYDRRVDGRTLTFSLSGADQLTDAETESTWDPVQGIATGGQLAGKRLQAFATTHALWSVWKRYRPDTILN